MALLGVRPKRRVHWRHTPETSREQSSVRPLTIVRARRDEILRPQWPDADALYRKVLLHLLPVLVIVYIIAYIDRSNVGFAKLGFMRDLKFSDTVFGIGAGVFYAGYMIFEIPSNLMLARIGFRKTLLRIMLLWAVCSAMLAAMTSPNSYYVARFLLGAAEAGLFPGVLLTSPIGCPCPGARGSPPCSWRPFHCRA
jgi:sugar phosphate permease